MFSGLLNEIIKGDLVIEFANQWVWWLLPLPLLVYRFFPAYRTHAESVQITNLADLASDNSYAVQKRQSAKKWPYILVSLIWLGLLATAARPEKLIIGEQQEVSVRDMLLVLDISGSMAIRDMQDEQGQTSRMQVMQKAVTDFIVKREHDNIGLIVFGSQALPLSPVSNDHQALLEQVHEMVPGMAGPQTSIGDAIGVAIQTFYQMDATKQQLDTSQPDSDKVEDSQSEQEPSERERMMVLLTDGLDTSSVLPPRVALRLAETQNVTIHSIAFGDVSEEDNTSIDTKLLKDIAQQTKGSFHQASESLASLQQVYDEIDKLAPRKVKLVGMTEREPLFTYPLLLSLVLAIFLCVLSLQKGKKDD